MNPRRLFTHVTVAFLFATLIGFQVLASAYPVQGDPPSHHQSINGNNSPRGRPASPSDSTASTSDVHPNSPSSGAVGISIALMTSEFPSGLPCLLNKDGLRRQRMDGPTWISEENARPVKGPLEWLDLENVTVDSDFPGVKPPKLNMALRIMAVNKLKNSCVTLKKWVSSDDEWLRKNRILSLQREMVHGLVSLTRFDVKYMTPDAKEGYEHQILRRMLVVLEMYEKPLSWGRDELILKEDITYSIKFYAEVLKERFSRDGYSLEELGLPKLIEKVKLEVEKEKNQGSRTATEPPSVHVQTHSS